MLEPLERFFRRVGALVLLDRAADPTANGQMQRNATHIKVYSGGAVRNLSDVGASATHALGSATHTTKAHSELTGVGTGDHHAESHTTPAMTATVGGHVPTPPNLATQFLNGTGLFSTPGGGVDIGARVYNSANISCADNVDTVMTFDTERWDTDTIHSTVSNTGRLTATTAGIYIITGHIRWAANNTGLRFLQVRLNGTTIIAWSVQKAADLGSYYTLMSIAVLYKLAATDYVELIARQYGLAGPLNVEAFANYSPEFGMQKVLG
jgi:hypothetical protein